MESNTEPPDLKLVTLSSRNYCAIIAVFITYALSHFLSDITYRIGLKLIVYDLKLD